MSMLSHVISPPATAFPKTRSPDRRTASWRHTAPSSSASRNFMPANYPSEAGKSGVKLLEIACSCKARRSQRWKDRSPSEDRLKAPNAWTSETHVLHPAYPGVVRRPRNSSLASPHRRSFQQDRPASARFPDVTAASAHESLEQPRTAGNSDDRLRARRDLEQESSHRWYCRQRSRSGDLSTPAPADP